MKLLFALVPLASLLTACGGSSGGDDDSSPTGCMHDTDCSGGDVCADDDLCLPPSQIHSVTLTWTIAGQPASSSSCAGVDHVEVNYGSQDPSSDFGPLYYSPVTCAEGEFPNIKWPIDYDLVWLNVVGTDGQSALSTTATIPSDPTTTVSVNVATVP